MVVEWLLDVCGGIVVKMLECKLFVYLRIGYLLFICSIFVY